jgi:electron transfer flavoprotein beta subunit
LKIVVCLKQVPDSWAQKRLNESNSTLDRSSTDAVINDLDEYAIEAALQIIEAGVPGAVAAGEVTSNTITLLSMGPERATEAIRKGLSMGVDDAVHIVDSALAGSDAIATSLVLAKVLADRQVDFVLCGTESTDARMAVVPAMLAERLGWPQLTFAGAIEVDETARVVRIKRITDDGVESMEASMPCVVSVNEKINEPRYPSFKNIMSAKKKPVQTLTLSDIGVESSQVGAAGAWTAVTNFQVLPARGAGIKITDDGTGGEQLVAFLTSKKLV